LVVTWGIALAIILYYFSFKKNLKIIDEVKNAEKEFSEAIYTLADKISTGIPLEASLEKVSKVTSHLTISSLFKKTLYNIKVLGLTLGNAVFDKHAGSVRYAPSKMIKSVMKILVDSVKKSVREASSIALSVSTHLKLMHTTEEDVRDITEEAVSSMKIECILLAPLTCGIVVAFASITMDLMISLGAMFSSFAQTLSGPAAPIGTGSLFLFQNINQVISPEYFQIVVGIYLIEVIYLLSMFQSKLENGEDEHSKNILIAKNLLIGCIAYTLILVLTVIMFSTLLPTTVLGV